MVFSVIVPVYNVEKYLPECVDSILSQTFCDFEVILVDDGSSDRSVQICDRYEKQDSRIRVIHKTNGGQGDARNVGTLVARGEYIIYIDSDDYIIRNDFFEHLNNDIDRNHSDLILYKFRKFVDASQKLLPCVFSLNVDTEERNGASFWFELVKRDAYFGMPWLKTVRRELIESNGIKFQCNLIGEDMDWFFYIVLCARKVSVLSL